MPAGIDTALFSPQPIQKESKRAYFQGRVAPAKHVGEICEAIQILHRTDTDVSLAIVGPEDLTYAERLKNDYGELIEMHALFFLGPKKTSQTPPLYAQARVAINLTAEGNYDKTVLEAMACGTLPIVGSKAFSDMIPSEWVVHPEDTAALSEKIERAFSLPDNDYASLTKAFREVVIARHDVGVLGTKVAEAFRGL
jgi:glycosyltransferase involved in cell wall biosynthesis